MTSPTPVLSLSPLRYPGGKQVLANVLAHLLNLNRLQGGTYAEAYAGGAGAGLSLLLGEHVSRIMINDADTRIYAFWKAVVHETALLVKLIETTKLTVREWERQRRTYQEAGSDTSLEVGFATFFLNRCNRSGIIARGGPIGGKDQMGKWKIDARFNRGGLADRIRRIAEYKHRIAISNIDAIAFLDVIGKLPSSRKAFVYLDPPYFAKGPDLYLNHYAPDDHRNLAKVLQQKQTFSWVLSYDDVPTIRRLYSDLRQVNFRLDYSARNRRLGREILILQPGLLLPSSWKSRIPRDCISISRKEIVAA